MLGGIESGWAKRPMTAARNRARDSEFDVTARNANYRVSALRGKAPFFLYGTV